MAKVAFSKLNKIKSLEAKEYVFNGVTIEIEQYLPLADKVGLMTRVIEQSGNGEEGFFNIVKLDAYYHIEMVKTYTNISFTEKQLEDPTKLYDALVLNDVWAFVEDKIPQSEREYIWDNILALAKETTNYQNSVLGVLKNITAQSETLDFDLTDLLDKINDPEALTLLKGMVQKTGLTN